MAASRKTVIADSLDDVLFIDNTTSHLRGRWFQRFASDLLVFLGLWIVGPSEMRGP